MPEEGAEVNDPYSPLFGDPKGPWIKAFAWLPTFTADAGRVWLCRVWKRHVHKHHYLDGGADWWWQHLKFKPAEAPK